MPKVSLLTIGNEVVDGQIVNRNASTLSQALITEHFEMDQHISVKDTLPEILRALDHLSLSSDIILTTGGLGPTTDDCTRQAVSQWLGQPLALHDESWQDIQTKLRNRNLVLRSDHKNQAYGPLGCTMLANPVGVAPGFYFKGKKTSVGALPGPPRELHGIWEDSLKSILTKEFKPSDGLQLTTWLCMGVAESEVQFAIKDLVQESKLNYGYRLSKPFVEVKIWWDKSQNKDLTDVLFPKIESALGAWYVGPTIAEARSPFFSRSKDFSEIQIYDGLSRGLYLNYFQKLLPKSTKLTYQMQDPEQLSLEIGKSLMTQSLGGKSLGFFIKNETTAFVVEDQQTSEIATDRNIPVTSELGRLIILERFFQRYGG